MGARRFLIHGVILLASLAPPLAAPAQDAPVDEPPASSPTDPSRVRQADPLRADQLFQEAIALSDQGRWQEACPKFRESLAAEASVGTLLNVASCSVKEGERLQAAREYRRVLELNLTTSHLERRQSVEAIARQALEKLEASLSRVTVRVTPEGTASRISIDGKLAARMGEPIETAPGKHTIEVVAEGFRPAKRQVDLAAGARDVIVIALEPNTPQSPPGKPAEPGRILGTAGWITGLGGAAFLTTGAILVGLAGDRAAEIRAECGPRVEPPACPLGSAETANDLASEGRAFAISGYVGLGIGGAALATGIGLLIADGTTDTSARPQVGASASDNEVGLWLSARF